MLDNYKIKDIKNIFDLEFLQDKIEGEGQTYQDLDGQEVKPLDIINSSYNGIYQTLQMVKAFTDIEINEQKYHDNLGLFIDEYEYHIRPKIEDQLNNYFNLKQGDILIHPSENNDILISIFY